jgi:nucleotide-binding universal stress UspA family protein
MFERVIAGIDGCDGGRDAAALGRWLGPEELHLLCAYPVDPMRTRAALRAYDDAIREDALRRLEAARVEAGVDVHLHAVGDTSPARALQREAEALPADLLVVGSSHRGTVGRVLLGDVSRGVLHGAPCPVAVVPHRFRARPGRPRTVIAAHDGSPEAQAAVRLAARLRDHTGAVLVVVRCIGSISVVDTSPLLVDWEKVLDDERAEAEADLRAAVGRLGGPAEVQVLVGDAGATLAAASADADLVVTGSRGWGTLKRVVLGSTSDHLVHRAACPVVVVPRPAVVDRADEPAAARADATA